MGPTIFDSKITVAFKRKWSTGKSRSYSCSAISPSRGLKVKIKRVEERHEPERKIKKVLRRIIVKISTKVCFVTGCGMSFNGTDDADANAKAQDHVIRTHEANGAEERKVYLVTQQATIFNGYLQKLKEAKELGIDTE